jgi:hypothetical protein
MGGNGGIAIRAEQHRGNNMLTGMLLHKIPAPPRIDLTHNPFAIRWLRKNMKDLVLFLLYVQYGMAI